MLTLTPLVIESATKHMILAEDRGTIYFACETNPLLSLRTFGPPEKCPCCGTLYPTSTLGWGLPVTEVQQEETATENA